MAGPAHGCRADAQRDRNSARQRQPRPLKLAQAAAASSWPDSLMRAGHRRPAPETPARVAAPGIEPGADGQPRRHRGDAQAIAGAQGDAAWDFSTGLPRVRSPSSHCRAVADAVPRRPLLHYRRAGLRVIRSASWRASAGSSAGARSAMADLSGDGRLVSSAPGSRRQRVGLKSVQLAQRRFGERAVADRRRDQDVRASLGRPHSISVKAFRSCCGGFHSPVSPAAGHHMPARQHARSTGRLALAPAGADERGVT
jgi:hypothetical protein